jgi:hypothetical protein
MARELAAPDGSVTVPVSAPVPEVCPNAAGSWVNRPEKQMNNTSANLDLTDRAVMLHAVSGFGIRSAYSGLF